MNQQINPSTTVGELVREQPSRSRVFESLRIDYCCGGKQPLSQACEKHGHDVESVVEQLAKSDEAATSGENAVDADAMTLSELADHIEQEHHAFLRDELPRLDAITEKVHRVHGEAEPRLADVRTAFISMRDELMSHMVKEERILFPMIRAIDKGDANASRAVGTVANPIRQMEAEHDDSGDALAIMHSSTDGYTPPDWACNTYRAMLDGLAHLERDLHQHIHKENNVLFPKALERERQLAGKEGA